MNIEFFIPGFSKCGTTTLCDIIGSHPDIFIPAVKEPSYYAENFGKGWEWYLDSFLNRGSKKLIGEGSTTYSSSEFAEITSERIRLQFPDCKFIFIARNPIDRLESSFREMHASGYKYDLVPAFRFGSALKQLPNMVADTKYWQLIQVFLERFPRNQLHVLFLEDFTDNPQLEIARCFDFLGVASDLANIDFSVRANSALTKVCDTKLLRWIRTNRIAAHFWRRIDLERQEYVMTRYRLRRAFTDPIEWDDYAKSVFNSELRNDAIQFLRAFAKSKDYWDFSKVNGSRPIAMAA